MTWSVACAGPQSHAVMVGTLIMCPYSVVPCGFGEDGLRGVQRIKFGGCWGFRTYQIRRISGVLGNESGSSQDISDEYIR